MKDSIAYIELSPTDVAEIKLTSFSDVHDGVITASSARIVRLVLLPVAVPGGFLLGKPLPLSFFALVRNS
jgi:hypothetical protein